MSQIEFKIKTPRNDEEIRGHLAFRFGQIMADVRKPEYIFWQEDLGKYQLGPSNDFWLRLYELPEEEGPGYRVILSCRYAPEEFLIAAKTIVTYRYEEIRVDEAA